MGNVSIIPQTKKKCKHILWEDRIVIEKMLFAYSSEDEIIKVIGCSKRTFKREIKRGTVTLRNSDETTREEYSATAAQAIHEKNGANKGAYAKINNAPELRKFLENKIKKEKFSPYAALETAKQEGFKVDFSVKTLYNNIDSGEIGVKRSDLLRKDGWKKKKKETRKGFHTKGKSIEERPKEADERSEKGHWEGDLVVSCKTGKGAILTLTERKTRREIITLIPDKSKKSIEKALKKVRQKHAKSHVFKTVTFDNGSEFLDFSMIERTLKCDVFYAHPYSSWERGTNENHNGIIRRFYPKGTDFSKIPSSKIQNVENWMNNYPRKILGGLSPNQYSKINI